MEQITTSTPSVAMATAREMAAHAAWLTTLTVAPDERAEMLNLLRETCEAFAGVTTNIANDVVEETSAGGTLGAPDWMPAAGRLVMELSHMGDYLCAARDGSKAAAEAVEDIATERAERAEQADAVGAELDTANGTIIDGRQALIDSGDSPGPDGAYMTKVGREALAQFRVKWAAQNGVTR